MPGDRGVRAGEELGFERAGAYVVPEIPARFLEERGGERARAITRPELTVLLREALDEDFRFRREQQGASPPMTWTTHAAPASRMRSTNEARTTSRDERRPQCRLAYPAGGPIGAHAQK